MSYHADYWTYGNENISMMIILSSLVANMTTFDATIDNNIVIDTVTFFI